MEKELKEYIYGYLDNRHRVEGNIVYLKDNEPEERISDLFGLDKPYTIFNEWAQDRMDGVYCFKRPYGREEWYKNGECHREDGPAIIYADDRKEWFKDGVYHRLDGPAIIRASGTKEWWLNGKIHREDGPAIIFTCGEKHWYKDGLKHRENGPAVIVPSGFEEWWVNGEKYHVKFYDN